jgi:hypothetical protein
MVGCSYQSNSPISGRAGKLISQLEGKWLDASGYHEHWGQMKNDTMSGEGAFLTNGKLEASEYLRIVNTPWGLVYEATVINQNEGRTIGFQLIDSNDSMLVFENQQHDFPNRISYFFINDSSLKIRVESLSDTSKYFELMPVRQ